MNASLLKYATDFMAKGGAGWVRALGLEITDISAGDVTCSLTVTPSLVHGGGVLCGQAIMGAVDTAMVYVMTSLHSVQGHERPFTTVSLNTTFERGVAADTDAITVHAWATKAGRSLVFGQIDCHLPDGKRAASATTTYMWL